MIPSYEAIKDSARSPVSSTGEVTITLGKSNIKLDNNGKIFKFLDANQVNGISPLNGPDTGGTIVTLTLDIDQTIGDIGPVYCIFAGSTSVLAVPSPPYDYT